jgi:DNA-binding beta-propeller fold protein YncE
MIPDTAHARSLSYSGPQVRRFLRASVPATLLLLCTFLGGCLEKVDAGIALNPDLKADKQLWRLTGEFGGDAELSVDDPDPYKKRFADGGFRQLRNVRAAGGEVWATDLGISRVQVFDSEGKFLRSYGQGVPLSETLASNKRLYEDRQKRALDPSNWNTQSAAPWAGAEGRLFQFSDVLPLNGKLWALDQAKSGLSSEAVRKAGLRCFDLPSPEQGSLDDLGVPSVNETANYAWPETLDCDGETLVVTEPWGNQLRLYNVKAGADLRTMSIGQNVNPSNILRLREGLGSNPQYLDFFRRDTNASGAPGKFARMGGAAIGFRKLVVCDAETSRLQVFDGNTEDSFFWGKLLRVIDAATPDGFVRYETPMDLDIAADGTVYVLDIKRMEIVILNSRFERIGSFGKGTMIEPLSIDLSDDGLHLYVADARYNKVLHFIREN